MPPITSLLLAGAVVLTGGAVATAPPASFSRFAADVSRLQESMISAAKAADPAAVWTVDCHSRGKAVILEEGDVWEKGCISVTQIDEGELSAVRAATISGRTGARIEAGARYSACALSFVLHARSPLVPTLRGDARVFVVGEREWYGGGLDLTPSYVEEEDCAYFHASLAALCGRHGPEGTYEAMKASCDDYFFLPCRQEHRGIGGVFFDDLAEAWAPAFCEDLLASALDPTGPYLPLVERRRSLPHSEAEKAWQLLRRGRYIEFNLLYDRGVKFGLSPDSVERVLVSSPPLVAFRYKASAEQPEGSREAATLDVLRHPRDWVAAGGGGASSASREGDSAAASGGGRE